MYQFAHDFLYDSNVFVYTILAAMSLAFLVVAIVMLSKIE